jgi:hypothetical protein
MIKALIKVIKDSNTQGVTITKGQTIPHPDTSHNLCLVNIRHDVRLNSRCCERRWHLKLKHMNLLLKKGDRRCLLFNLKVLLLDGVLEVYDHVSVLIHQLARRVKLLMNVLPRVLGLTEAIVQDLQLPVLF